MTDGRYFFYVSDPSIAGSLPQSSSIYWQWVLDRIANSPVRDGEGQPTRFTGPYSWTVETWLLLKESGCDVALVSEIPREGIVLAHSDFWRGDQRATRDQFFVEIKPDRSQKLRAPDFLIVQGPADPAFHSRLGRSGAVAMVDHWPQSSLIPRDPARGNRIATACFVGNRENFLDAGDVARLEEELAGVGVRFAMRGRGQWNNFSDVDLSIGVRPPSYFKPRHRSGVPMVLMKPALKLTNAWLAGVPSILSPEPAYKALRRSPHDYLEASSVAEIVAAVRQLRENPLQYEAMVANARSRAPAFEVKPIAAQWIDLLTGRIADAFAARQRRRWFHIFGNPA